MFYRIKRNVVLLQYPKLGEPDGHGRSTRENEAEKFVAIDGYSGGYPYAVTVDQAHDFKTVEKAQQYIGHFDQFTVRLVEITYSFDDK